MPDCGRNTNKAFSGLMKRIGERLWLYDGETVNFFGLPYSTRMTVIKLGDQRLWIHSPIRLNAAVQEEVNRLGKVRYLIAPNKLHHLFLPQWQAAYPDAESYAAPGLSAKRPDIRFTKELCATAETAWQDDIRQTVFGGSPLMEEVVFFHVPSKTLILTDLIENFSPVVFNRWQRLLAGLTGIIAPYGKMPLDLRLSFIFGKKQAGKALATMLAWQPNNIVLAHGECVFGDGVRFLRRSFSWLV